MLAVIMAGGKGTRLVQLTKGEIPKPMVEILGKPLIEWQVEAIKKNGISEIIFVIGHLGSAIRGHFGDGSRFGIKAEYIEETEPLGTAGALFYLKDRIGNEPFLLVFGDVLFDIDLGRMADFHTKNNAAATLFVHPNSHPFDSDLVELSHGGKVAGFHLKLGRRDFWYRNCVNAGLYIISPEVCGSVSTPVRTDLEKDVLSKLVAEGAGVFAYRSPEYIKDIGTVERIEQAKRDIESGLIGMRCLKKQQKCIFLDRDGTVTKYKGLLSCIDDLELEDGVAAAIRKVNSSGWLCVVVTNQSVVARGLCSLDDVEKIHMKMETLLGRDGAYLDDVLFCPHHPDKGYPEENPAYKIRCRCRKPATGMLEEAAARYNIDLPMSWIVGDTTLDIQTGRNAGTHTALVLTGEAGKDGKYAAIPELTGSTLLEIVDRIMGGK